MPNFVKLTNITGISLWVNLDHVLAIMPLNLENATRLYTAEYSAQAWDVKETVEEMLEQAGFRWKLEYWEFLRWREQQKASAEGHEVQESMP